MHDLDRVQLELDDIDEVETDEFDEFEFDDDETGWDDDELPFGDEEEAELAMELLSVSNDEELNYFFKKLIRKAARGVRKIRKSLVAPDSEAFSGCLDRSPKRFCRLRPEPPGQRLVDPWVECWAASWARLYQDSLKLIPKDLPMMSSNSKQPVALYALPARPFKRLSKLRQVYPPAKLRNRH
jgi:hypothetical protein